MKCLQCGAASRVLETRGEKRFRQCFNDHRFETVEAIVPATRARITPAEIQRRQQAALAMPYVNARDLALTLGCAPKTIRSIRARAYAR